MAKKKEIVEEVLQDNIIVGGVDELMAGYPEELNASEPDLTNPIEAAGWLGKLVWVEGEKVPHELHSIDKNGYCEAPEHFKRKLSHIKPVI